METKKSNFQLLTIQILILEEATAPKKTDPINKKNKNNKLPNELSPYHGN